MKIIDATFAGILALSLSDSAFGEPPPAQSICKVLRNAKVHVVVNKSYWVQVDGIWINKVGVLADKNVTASIVEDTGKCVHSGSTWMDLHDVVLNGVKQTVKVSGEFVISRQPESQTPESKRFRAQLYWTGTSGNGEVSNVSVTTSDLALRNLTLTNTVETADLEKSATAELPIFEISFVDGDVGSP